MCPCGSHSRANKYGDEFTTLLRSDVGNAQDWPQVLIDSAGLNENPVVPVIIYLGTTDAVVPPLMHEIDREEMCKLCSDVARVQRNGGKTYLAIPGAAQLLYTYGCGPAGWKTSVRRLYGGADRELIRAAGQVASPADHSMSARPGQVHHAPDCNHKMPYFLTLLPLPTGQDRRDEPWMNTSVRLGSGSGCYQAHIKKGGRQ